MCRKMGNKSWEELREEENRIKIYCMKKLMKSSLYGNTYLLLIYMYLKTKPPK